MIQRADATASPDTTTVDLAIGVRLQVTRRQVGLSREELATAAGMSTDEITAFEAGSRSVPANMLVRIAQALGVSPTVFLSELPFLDPTTECPAEVAAFLLDPAALRLAQLAATLQTPTSRERLVALVEALIDQEARSAA